MDDSILNSVKKNLGIPTDYDVFDTDIIMHINLAFSTLYQLGIGKDHNLRIDSKEQEWKQLFKEYDSCLDFIKDYTYLKVRVLFDPPTTSFVLDALNNNIKEIEWRIQLQLECIDDLSDEPKGDESDTIPDSFVEDLWNSIIGKD